ncbi:hypothetical protein [Cohnella cellulosilytica]|uniref:Uncharacterized protein n=1 Tax=Cohnella cellulosilytica TaxID=986710 RepID=A0ABW2F527_9BACL
MIRPMRRLTLRWSLTVLLACGLAGAGEQQANAKRPADRPERLEMTVRASGTAAMFSSLKISSPRLASRIAAAERRPAERVDCYTDLEVSVWETDDRKTVYRLERTGRLWDEAASKLLWLPPDASERLLRYAEALRSRHYGKLMDWNEARSIVGRKSLFTIVDLESGLSFRVQRRAGSDHADVQPVSREDSATMKRIYGDKWSWERRAIVVAKDGARIAASMNGMPHGGDGIPDNGFKGHFCVHFLGSTSHRSDTPDPAHQLMVHKAGGDLRRYFDSASPAALASSFVEALNLKDGDMLSLIWTGASAEETAMLSRLLERLDSIYYARAGKLAQDDDGDKLSASVDLPVLVRLDGRGTLRAKLRFELARSSPQSPWRIVGLGSDHSSLIP